MDSFVRSQIDKAKRELDRADNAPQPSRGRMAQGDDHSVEDHLICALRALTTAIEEMAQTEAAP